MTYFSHFEWPLGTLLLQSDGEAVTGVHFVGGRYVPHADGSWRESDDAEPFVAVRKQLKEYFAGDRPTFSLPLRPEGTAFQKRVWDAIAEVAFGQTITYRDLATRVGSPNGSRAAGLATGRNPIALIIPCHRIVGTHGSLTGYGGGLDRKKALLDFEGAVANGRRARLEQSSMFDD